MARKIILLILSLVVLCIAKERSFKRNDPCPRPEQFQTQHELMRYVECIKENVESNLRYGKRSLPNFSSEEPIPKYYDDEQQKEDWNLYYLLKYGVRRI